MAWWGVEWVHQKACMGLAAPAKSCKKHTACFSKTASETSPELSLFTPRLSHALLHLSVDRFDSCCQLLILPEEELHS